MAYGLTVLALVQEFCARTALPQPTTIFTKNEIGARQMAGLLNEEFDETKNDFQWTSLLQQCTFQTVGTSIQGSLDTLAGFPVDYILNDIMWNTDTRLPIFGPVDPQRWEQYKALPITGTLLQYRIENGNLLFYPLTPPVGNHIIFEAAARFPVVDNTGGGPVFKQFFTLDTDQCLFTDEQMISALRWRWKREKGLAYAEDQARWMKIVSRKKMRDGTGRILNMNGDEENFGPGILVPSGSWNLSGGGLPGGAWDSTI